MIAAGALSTGSDYLTIIYQIPRIADRLAECPWLTASGGFTSQSGERTVLYRYAPAATPAITA